MLRRVTALWTVALFLLMAAPTAWAQTEVTIDQLNQIPPANLTELLQKGADLTEEEIETLIMPELTGEEVQITAVVLTDPLSSGLSSFDSDRGGPNRLHVFVRDTEAATAGPEGMGMQLVDANYETTGLINVFVGDVVRITGQLDYFGTTSQFVPETVEVLGSYTDLGLPDSILDPVLIDGTDALNTNVGPQTNQVNWENYSDLINQYVRIENATILRRTLADSGRPNWNFSTDGGETFSQNDDISLRYRNDRIGSYPDTWNVRSADNPFVPPAPGSIANVEGFVVFRGAFEAFEFVGQPSGAFLQVAPFSDDDLEVVSEPTITLVEVDRPSFVPGADAVPVTVTVEAATADAIADVRVDYTSTGGSEGSVTLADQGDGTFTGEIPALEDGAFVTYTAVVTDAGGLEFAADPVTYRILTDGIDEIEDIQLPADPEGEETGSPFEDVTTAMDLTATVQSNPSGSGFLTVQDDSNLGPWSGIFVIRPEGVTVNPGDVVRITEATIVEAFGVTTLEDVTLEVVSTGGSPLGYLDVATSVLQSDAIAEAHEGMLLRFDEVVITDVNADGDDAEQGFGEWQFSSDGTEDNEVRADDASDAIPQDFNVTNFVEGARVEYIQGLWGYSFGNYKLWPETPDDIGMIITSSEDDELPGRFALEQNYPNPFNPTTKIAYELGAPSAVQLTVFDVLGRQVATLVDGPQPAGAHDVVFEASNLPSGLYLYRLEAGGQTLTRSMLLLK